MKKIFFLISVVFSQKATITVSYDSVSSKFISEIKNISDSDFSFLPFCQNQFIWPWVLNIESSDKKEIGWVPWGIKLRKPEKSDYKTIKKDSIWRCYFSPPYPPVNIKQCWNIRIYYKDKDRLTENAIADSVTSGVYKICADHSVILNE